MNGKEGYYLSGFDFNGIKTFLGIFKNKKTAIKELDRIQDMVKYYMEFKNGQIPIVEINEDYEVE